MHTPFLHQQRRNAFLLCTLIVGGACMARPPKVVPTFECLSLYWNTEHGSPDNTCRVRYRKVGTAQWSAALPLWFDRRGPESFRYVHDPDRHKRHRGDSISVGDFARQYRGSIVDLQPGTQYEIELHLEEGQARELVRAGTWDHEFPTGRTTILPEQSGRTLRIDQSGTPAGYALYTHQPGAEATIDVAGNSEHCVEVRASYVILRGLTCRNAGTHGIRIYDDCHDVVIDRCDISGWGRPDELEGSRWGHNMDAAVYARESNMFVPSIERIIVQRCRIHHPRHDTNSWSEYRKRLDPKRNDKRWHPNGPQAITFYDTLGNHVIRYNDIWSDADHYYNDIIGGGHNFSALGAPNRDSDIYGNRLSHCWDDAIESEGANCNVRIWGNYISRSMVAIASAATHAGPLYIWRNVTAVSQRRPDELSGGPFLKAGIGSIFGGGRTYVFHNTLLQPGVTEIRAKGTWQGHGLGLSDWGGALINHVSRNNIWHVYQQRGYSIQERRDECRDNDYDYDLYSGRVIPANRHQVHGIHGTPRYDPAAPLGRYPLAADSPGRDAGLAIPYFNDHYAGAGPDIGAFETDGRPLEFGVGAYGGADRPH